MYTQFYHLRIARTEMGDGFKNNKETLDLIAF